MEASLGPLLWLICSLTASHGYNIVTMGRALLPDFDLIADTTTEEPQIIVLDQVLEPPSDSSEEDVILLKPQSDSSEDDILLEVKEELLEAEEGLADEAELVFVDEELTPALAELPETADLSPPRARRSSEASLKQDLLGQIRIQRAFLQREMELRVRRYLEGLVLQSPVREERKRGELASLLPSTNVAQLRPRQICRASSSLTKPERGLDRNASWVEVAPHSEPFHIAQCAEDLVRCLGVNDAKYSSFCETEYRWVKAEVRAEASLGEFGVGEILLPHACRCRLLSRNRDVRRHWNRRHNARQEDANAAIDPTQPTPTT